MTHEEKTEREKLYEKFTGQVVTFRSKLAKVYAKSFDERDLEMLRTLAYLLEDLQRSDD